MVFKLRVKSNSKLDDAGFTNFILFFISKSYIELILSITYLPNL